MASGQMTQDQPQVKTTQTVNHDWYQTESTVVLSIMVNNPETDVVQVMYGQQTVSVSVRNPDNSELVLGFSLAHQVVPAHSSQKIFTSKIELILKKLEDIIWEKLEAEPQNPAIKEGTPKPGENKNWDKVVVELSNSEDDKPQGEAALNCLSQQICGDGSEEGRSAFEFDHAKLKEKLNVLKSKVILKTKRIKRLQERNYILELRMNHVKEDVLPELLKLLSGEIDELISSD